MRRFLGVLLILILLWGAGCADETAPATVTPGGGVGEPAGSPQAVSPSSLTVLADGVLVAEQPVLTLAAAVGGELQSVAVQVGDRVAAGDVLATVDDSQLQDVVANARAALAVAEAQLAQLTAPPDPGAVAAAEAQVQVAAAGVVAATAAFDRLFLPLDQASIIEADARVAELEEALQGAIAYHEQLILNEILGAPEEAARRQVATVQLQLDAARARARQLRSGPLQADRDAAAAAIDQAEAGLAQAEAQRDQLLAPPDPLNGAVIEAQIAQAVLALAQAEAALDQAVLRAPVDGTVLAVNGVPGLVVGPGSPLVVMQDLSRLLFETSNVSERDLPQLAVGLAAQVTLKAYPAQPLAGRIARVADQAAGAVGDSAVFAVFIALEETALPLRAGLSGRVEITVGER